MVKTTWNFNLLPYAKTYENIELPMLFNGRSGKRRRQRVLELLEMVGLVDWRDHRPSELSGHRDTNIAACSKAASNDAFPVRSRSPRAFPGFQK